MNKSQAAARLGISSQLLGQYEKGSKNPKTDFFIKWKRVFGDDIMKLMETNVSDEIKRSIDPEEEIGSIEERLLRIESHLEVYENAIAGLLSKEPSDFMKKISEIRDEVIKATNRRLDELRKPVS